MLLLVIANIYNTKCKIKFPPTSIKLYMFCSQHFKSGAISHICYGMSSKFYFGSLVPNEFAINHVQWQTNYLIYNNIAYMVHQYQFLIEDCR
jgi:hypothetical protein